MRKYSGGRRNVLRVLGTVPPATPDVLVRPELGALRAAEHLAIFRGRTLLLFFLVRFFFAQ